MDWIFDNFQILALVGIALASWLKSRADAKAAEREARREMDEAEEVFGPQEQWSGPEPWNLPQEPPPLVVRPQAPPPLPAALREAAEELKRQQQLQERLRELRETKAVTTGGAAATRAARTPAAEPVAVSPVPGRLRGILRDRREIRRAVVLREVLGPPVGLR